MPLLMEKLERAGCPKPIVGLVVPTGYSFNLDGTNIYMSLAALFIAQATATRRFSFGDQLLLMAVAIISSKGAAGVTGSGFIVARRDLVGGAGDAGRRHGADPRRRPLHERVPRADQLHRQCGRDDRRRALGGRGRPGPARAAFRGEGGEFTESESDALQIEGRSDVRWKGAANSLWAKREKMKLVIGVVAGVVVAIACVSGVETVGHVIYPPPPGLDLTEPETWRGLSRPCRPPRWLRRRGLVRRRAPGPGSRTSSPSARWPAGSSPCW